MKDKTTLESKLKMHVAIKKYKRVLRYLDKPTP